MIVIQVFNKFPVFMEAEDTLECSQDPATEPCPEPVKANVHGCIQKFPDWANNEMNNNNKHSLGSNTKGYGCKTHYIDS